MPVVVKTVTVSAKGVGRKDYSANVEHAVEPLIRSYQSDYHHREPFEGIAPGASLTKDILVPTETVVMLYDFTVSVKANALIELEVYAVKGASVLLVTSEIGYQKVEAKISRGFPFFEKIRVTVRNRSDVALDFEFHCHGVYTSEEEYYLRVHILPGP